jgi:hypothetical protein
MYLKKIFNLLDTKKRSFTSSEAPPISSPTSESQCMSHLELNDLIKSDLTASTASPTVARGWRKARTAMRPLSLILEETSTFSTSSEIENQEVST